MNRRQGLLPGFILIGVGLYFSLKQLKIPVLENFNSWPTLLIIIGVILLLNSYFTKSYQNIFSSVIILGLGIHFYSVNSYSFWIDHWAVYVLIVGIAFFVRYLTVKKGLFQGVILTIIALLLLFPVNIPEWFNWTVNIPHLLRQYWPVLIIGLGVYLLVKKR